jgi:L-ascorbate metabolism protein UlaG (beta-lactamase superfamily)
VLFGRIFQVERGGHRAKASTSPEKIISEKIERAPVLAPWLKGGIAPMTPPFPLPLLPRELAPRDANSPVRVRWLGTAGFEISAGGTSILIDPYITRARLADCVLRPLASDLAEIARVTPRADAIIVGHTHFDHALDVPTIAMRTGATVFGSRSAVALCRASRVPETRLVNVEREPGQPPFTAEVGPFKLRFAASAHSRFLLGRVPFPGEIQDCDHVPLRTEKYRCGAVFRVEIEVMGRTIVHLGSAELVERVAPPKDVDLLLLCVAGWQSSDHFPERVARALDPRAVLLSHWDNFFTPLDTPVRALPAMAVQKLSDRLTRVARDAKVGAIPPLSEVVL